MKKPNRYEETQAAGEFTPIELGAHYMIIRSIAERNQDGTSIRTKNGVPMIKVFFDFAQNDKQPNYFLNQYRNDFRPRENGKEKEWPFAGTAYIQTETDDGACSPRYKAFTTSVEKSNPGFTVWWADDDSQDSSKRWCEQFKNKMVGGVFQEVLDVYDTGKGLKESKKRNLNRFCSVDKVPEIPVPDTYETQAHKSWKASGGLTTAAPDQQGFMNIPDNVDGEELPFN